MPRRRATPSIGCAASATALFARVIAVGEESGDLSEMLGVVADIFDLVQ